MFFNSTINTIYFTIWAKLPSVAKADVDNENGVTTLEWLALGMVMVVTLMVFWTYFKDNAQSKLAEPIMTNLNTLITKAFEIK